MIEVVGVPFEIVLSPYPTGRAAQLSVVIFDPTDGTDLLLIEPPDIAETEPQTYRAQATVTTVGAGRIIRWRRNGNVVAEEPLDVLSEDAPATPPIPLAGAPTPAELRDWSEVAAVDAADDVKLGRWINRAVAYVEQTTGRIPITTVPAALAEIARQAVQMRVEQIALGSTAQGVAAQVNVSRTTSFSVPGYSRSVKDSASDKPHGDVVNSWPALNDLLWLLMTPERRAEWAARLGLDGDDVGLEFVSLG